MERERIGYMFAVPAMLNTLARQPGAAQVCACDRSRDAPGWYWACLTTRRSPVLLRRLKTVSMYGAWLAFRIRADYPPPGCISVSAGK